MAYNVYQDDELIAEAIENKECIVEGLTPNTEYSFSVTEVINNEESEKATIIVKTKTIAVTSVSLSPNNMTGISGAASSRQLTATIEPPNATNKKVSYAIEPTTDGLTVNSKDVLAWTDKVPAGTYTVTVTADDGKKTDTSTLVLSEPAPEPEEG